MKNPEPRLGATALASACIWLVVGCAPVGQDAHDVVHASLEQAAAATETAVLVISLAEAGDLPAAAAATALDDTLDTIREATTSLAALDVSDRREAELRADALRAIQASMSAIVASTSVLDLSPETPEAALPRLLKASDLVALVTREASR